MRAGAHGLPRPARVSPVFPRDTMNSMKKIRLILFLLVIAASGCGPSGRHAGTSAEQEVAQAVHTYFTHYKGRDFREIDHGYLSGDLSSLLQQSMDREQREIVKTAKSAYPTDKPFIMEGDLFSSLYEGADAMRIRSIHITSGTATVDVLFSHTERQHTTEWNDCLLLVQENGWKVDNVIFKSGYAGMKSTKDTLREYIHAKEE
ncbi:exported hypothetical protein [uncultured delta proteobacterium]|uniref:Uncharacterized protein n=1 Tax=uncultured delta proteobacterium TaxID=34034 RepID=A0A212KA27_9DELT|nr:exported hypothetical protein [uncultured delta proteobacterium]